MQNLGTESNFLCLQLFQIVFRICCCHFKSPLGDFSSRILFRNIKTFKRSALLRHLSNRVLLKPVEPVIIPSDRESIPNKIEKPHYVKKAFEKKSLFESSIKPTNRSIQTEDIVERIRQACRLGRRILNHLAVVTKVSIIVFLLLQFSSKNMILNVNYRKR